MSFYTTLLIDSLPDEESKIIARRALVSKTLIDYIPLDYKNIVDCLLIGNKKSKNESEENMTSSELHVNTKRKLQMLKLEFKLRS